MSPECPLQNSRQECDTRPRRSPMSRRSRRRTGARTAGRRTPPTPSPCGGTGPLEEASILLLPSLPLFGQQVLPGAARALLPARLRRRPRLPARRRTARRHRPQAPAGHDCLHALQAPLHVGDRDAQPRLVPRRQPRRGPAQRLPGRLHGVAALLRAEREVLVAHDFLAVGAPEVPATSSPLPPSRQEAQSAGSSSRRSSRVRTTRSPGHSAISKTSLSPETRTSALTWIAAATMGTSFGSRIRPRHSGRASRYTLRGTTSAPSSRWVSARSASGRPGSSENERWTTSNVSSTTSSDTTSRRRPWIPSWRRWRSFPRKKRPEIRVFVSTATRVVPPPNALPGLRDQPLHVLALQAEMPAAVVEHLEDRVDLPFLQHPELAIALQENEAAAFLDPHAAADRGGEGHLALGGHGPNLGHGRK